VGKRLTHPRIPSSQAVCSRHALEIGAKFVGLVKILRFLLYPIAKPIAICLDLFLGQEMGQIYTREELKGLVDVHNRNKYGVLTSDEASILKGTLDLESKNVAQIMTKAENIFMLDVDGKLGRDTLKSILHYGKDKTPVNVKPHGIPPSLSKGTVVIARVDLGNIVEENGLLGLCLAFGFWCYSRFKLGTRDDVLAYHNLEGLN